MKNTVSKRIKQAAAMVATVALLGAASASMAMSQSGGDFVDKKYDVAGEWSLSQKGDNWVVSLSDNFDTKGGPDLKVFLSPESIDEVTGRTATNGSVLLGVLKSTSGAQEYVLPEGVNPDNFGSLLIHCEQYSVLWGGANL